VRVFTELRKVAGQEFKPFDEKQLVRAIRKALRKKQARTTPTLVVIELSALPRNYDPNTPPFAAR
jgi:hypothetical protein